MHCFPIIIKFLVLFSISLYFSVGFVDTETSVAEDIIKELYLKYKEAVKDDTSNISLRRFFKNDKQYEVHVKKLKEVNGFKTHNLMIKESLRTESNPLIYINNPVESKIPNAFLSIDEFKSVLTNRVLKQRAEVSNKAVTFTVKNYVLPNSTPKTTSAILINNPRYFFNQSTYKKIDIKSTATGKKIRKQTTGDVQTDVTESMTKDNITQNLKSSVSTVSKIVSDIVSGVRTVQSRTITAIPTLLSLNSKTLPNLVLQKEKKYSKTAIKPTSGDIFAISKTSSINTTNHKVTFPQSEISSKRSSTKRDLTSRNTYKMTNKEGPKRKTTSKFTTKLTTLSSKTKRTTLGRPLVFMGG